MTERNQEILGMAHAEELLRGSGASSGKPAVTQIVPRTGGQLSTVYEVRCADPAQSAIFKVYAEQWRWKQSKEVLVYSLLAERTELPIPTVLHHMESGGPGDQAVTILSLLPGRPLSEAAADLGPDEIVEMYRQMGAILADVHQIEQEAFGYLATEIIDPLPDNGSYMRGQFAKKLKEFEQLGGDPHLHAAAARLVDRDGGLFDNCDGPVLCHNDLHEGNVLVSRGADGRQITGVIDVENAIAADPLIDLAKTDYYALGRGEAERAALLEGYGPLPADAAERLNLYRLYHAVELWDWFCSIGTTGPLAGIAADIARFTVGNPPR